MLILLSLTLSILSNAVSEVSFLNNRKDLRELGEESSIHQQKEDSHHVRAGFKYYYVDHNGQIYTSHVNPSIKIAATQCVSQTAHYKAAQMIGLMVKHMSSSVFSGIATRGHGIGIFCHNEKVTVFPEFYSLRNKASCGSSCSGSCRSTCTADGRKMEDLGGVTNSLSGVREDRIICNNFPGAENILVHEFAHQIYNYMPSSDHNRIDYVYNYAKQHHIWTVGTYAMANPTEFWAEATQAFFHVTGRSDVTGGLNMCNNGQYACRSESEGRAYLQKRDPWLFDELSKIYTNNQPNTPSGLTAC